MTASCIRAIKASFLEQKYSHNIYHIWVISAKLHGGGGYCSTMKVCTYVLLHVPVHIKQKSP